jgi:hypothetical protein
LEQIADQLVSLARVQERLHSLYEVALSRDVDLRAVLRTIVTTAMDLVGARYGALGVLDTDGEGNGGLAELIGVGSSEKQRADIEGLHSPEGRGLLGHLIHAPVPLRVDNISEHPDSAGFPPGHPEMRTLLGVPIHIRGQIYGNLYIADRLDGCPFNAQDETMVVALAGAAGLAIDGARLFRQLRDDAEEFQRLLVPRLPDLSPFEAAAVYRPAPSPGLLGGDWYDALLVCEDTCVAVIGDVLGHDVPAAAAMAHAAIPRHRVATSSRPRCGMCADATAHIRKGRVRSPSQRRTRRPRRPRPAASSVGLIIARRGHDFLNF